MDTSRVEKKVVVKDVLMVRKMGSSTVLNLDCC
jgi:hypothetical protein